MKKFIAISILFLIFPVIAQAWDMRGHLIIAQIAFDNLKPETKEKIKPLLVSNANHEELRYEFLKAAIWPDIIRAQGNKTYNNWHYISLPITQDGVSAYPIPRQNIILAINQAIATLKNRKASVDDQVLALKFLIHLVGDAHQPLHCAELFSKKYRYGDHGGNLFTILDDKFSNLHAYWDSGLGMFKNRQSVRHMAKILERKYPPTFFGQKINDLNVANWVHECFLLAKKNAYNISPNTEPSLQYKEEGEIIVNEQIALAGYRLAYLLNQLE